MSTQTTDRTPKIAMQSAILLTSLLGLQLLRGLFPYFRPLLGERLGWSTINSGVFALIIFLFAFLAWPLNRFLGSGLVLVITGFALGLSRLAVQLWNGDPIGDLIYLTAGVIAFILFLPTAVGMAVRAGSKICSAVALSILAALAIDLAISGAYYSYDLIWQPGVVTSAIVVVLVLLQWYLLFRLLRQPAVSAAMDTRFLPALSWAAIGPFLFLQFLIFANTAWVASSTGWSFPTSLFWLLLAHVCGLLIWLLPQKLQKSILFGAWIVAAISQFLLWTGQTSPWIVALYLLAGQVALAGTFTALLIFLGENGSLDNLRNISVVNGFGLILMVILLFAYYAAYDLAMPFSNHSLPLVALVLVFIFGSAALRRMWQAGVDVDQPALRWLLLPLLVTLLIPAILQLTSERSTVGLADDLPLRVMTYNLHYGANVQGQLDLESMAQVIEAQNPDVVGLQEVSRGWIINGSVDMLSWLANRLEMQAVFGPAADQQWGNAILTKVPVIQSANYPLPTEELLLKRAFMHVQLQGPGEAAVNFINTHYHHQAEGGPVRIEQSQTLIDYASGLDHLIMTGDLNAEHGDQEIDMLANEGFRDAIIESGLSPAHTSPVPNPVRRIDYIWVSPGWGIDSASIPYSEASDHLPIAVSLTTND